MGLSNSSRSNQHGTAVALDEVAVEQPHDRGLEDLACRNLKSYSAKVFGKNMSSFTHPPLESSLLTGGLFHPDQ